MSISRQVESQHRILKVGICPHCGIRARAYDPRYKRNIEVRVAHHRGQSRAAIAKRFKIDKATVYRILKSPLGAPRLLSRCELCQVKNNATGRDLRAKRQPFHSIAGQTAIPAPFSA